MTNSNCVICNKAPANACAVCKSASYCSKACQRIDWPVHKTLCKKISTPKNRPDIPCRLGILLSADNPEPRLVWVPCSTNDQLNSAGGKETPDLDALLAYPEGRSERFNVSMNEVRGYKLDHTVVVYARDNWLNDGSKPNQAALALTDWEMPFDWRGNLVVMSYPGMVKEGIAPPELKMGNMTIPLHSVGGEVEPQYNFQDVTMADLRIAVDYLLHYGVDVKRGTEQKKQIANLIVNREQIDTRKDLPQKKKAHRKVQGVLIRCEGDISLCRKEFGGWERYSQIEVPADHAIWDSTPTEASKIMGLPLLVAKLPPNPLWNQNDHTRFDNQPATFLNLTVDPRNEEMWGFAPFEWQSQVGSVLLVRQDGKDLSREHGWAFAEYMQFRVSDAFEEAMEAQEDKARRTAVLKMLNWSSFENFLKNFKVEMAAGDNKIWETVQSPFGTREVVH